MIGSPLYDVLPEHGPAIAAILLLPLGAWLLRRRASAADGNARRLVEAYQALPAIQRLLAGLLLGSAAVHLGLVIGHRGGESSGIFAAAALAMVFIARRLVLGGRWRRWAALVLFGSVVAYWAAIVGGEAPDEVGIVTKLVEIAALAIVIRPATPGRARAAASGVAVICLVVITSVVGWIGAFAVAGSAHGESERDHGHLAGGLPTPGTLLSAMDVEEPTPEQREAAASLLATTSSAIARYVDLAAAQAAGYQVDGLFGLDFHAGNTVYENDGRVLDPARPESLVYAESPRGPVLLGALFMMPSHDRPVPAVGGPALVWHGHEHVCISLIPPSMTGLLSPLGGCPVGSIDVPSTPPMIHVWTVAGAPQPFGDLPDEWRRAYVAALE